jgi:hypothetical protein
LVCFLPNACTSVWHHRCLIYIIQQQILCFM